MKIISLIKAVLSQDMNMFKYSTKSNSSKTKKILLPVSLFILVCFSIGTYAYKLAEFLSPFKLTEIMLSIFIAIVTIIAFTEGISKSQGILFEAKDNNLLFSLPIKKRLILFIKIFKLLVFEYLFNLMFILPAFIVYIYFENPDINFYLISLLMTFLIPIIPTILSSIIGYIIKMISSKSQAQKIIQVLLTSLIFIGIFLLSMNIKPLLQNLVNNASDINNFLTKLYYPIGAYMSLISKFNIIIFFKLVLINIIPLIIFIFIGEKYYFKIISNQNNQSIKTPKINNKKITTKKPIKSLTIKELKRYFSSSTYMFNTSFGLIIMLILTIGLTIKNTDFFQSMLSNEISIENYSLEILYYCLILFSLALTSITSSSISLEGKTINITKSLPINYKTLFKSKILTCFIIELPFALLSLILYILKFKPSLIYIVELLAIIVIFITFEAVVGLLINLKYPKLNASNDTEVVKQSMSSMISVFIGFISFVISLIYLYTFINYLNLSTLLFVHILFFSILTIIMYYLLLKIGPKEYQTLNV